MIKWRIILKNTGHLCFFLVLFIWGTSLYAAENEFQEQLKILEGHQKNLDENYKNKLEDLNKKFDLKSKSVEQEIRKINDFKDLVNDKMAVELAKIDGRLERFEFISYGFLGIGTLVGIVSFVIFVIHMRKYARKKAEESFDARFEESVEKILNMHKEHLIALIEKHVEEKQIKNEKQIMILRFPGVPSEGQGFIKDFLETIGFQKVIPRVFEANETPVFGEYPDLVLFDNENDAMKPNDILDFVDQLPDSVICFYFGKPQKEFQNSKLSFANVKTQLYGNLMSALRYQSFLKCR